MGRFECFECGKPANHAHHVVPVRLGGTRTLPLCVGLSRSQVYRRLKCAS